MMMFACGAGNDRLTGVSSSGPNRGRGELDTLTGGAGLIRSSLRPKVSSFITMARLAMALVILG